MSDMQNFLTYLESKHVDAKRLRYFHEEIMALLQAGGLSFKDIVLSVRELVLPVRTPVPVRIPISVPIRTGSEYQTDTNSSADANASTSVDNNTSTDSNALSVLGPAFREGDVDALIDFLFANFDYCYNILP